MLEFGFSPHTRNHFGEAPLHLAVAAGDTDTVRLLLDHGAELDARDDNYHGTPLGHATVNIGESSRSDGDWAATVRLLLDAGADRTGVWVSGMPPREDVAEVLHDYGITGNANGDIRPYVAIGGSATAAEQGASADADRHLLFAKRRSQRTGGNDHYN